MNKKLSSVGRIAAAIFGLVASASAQGAIVTQWNFNSGNDALPSTGTLVPSIGTGVASIIGGTTSTFATGSPADPLGVATGNDNSGLNVSAFPAATTLTGTAGARFTTSTASITAAIEIQFDFRQSGTSSKYYQLQATTDGLTYTNVSSGTASIAGPINSPNTGTSFSNTGLYTNSSGSGSQTFVQGLDYVFPTGAGFENNPNFGFQFVSVFDPANNASYTGSNSTYSSNGTARFDIVTVGAPLPEPTTLSLIGIGAMGLLARRRK